ncbi:tRNA (adenosine(37)-N6)-threonylcarbamoyltransferase complex dimerization subunit type 1 TsaB [Polynucleobacter sp. IMCC30063]|uniref:tRNA (adenosine(37)-N6)-threonylcarbamoyltransferase complex dimerization subunit type 1 TsaB n=1 Tax=unclassified Polynucleobacter TaxID=2640945 RepID=UPI001F3D0A7B|nr:MULTISPECIES: tRNA (adenosine(37)-N6)-threonylcarbamoyltransferase complex dimerization subunit type 1 TsaB [unclassified Polynucleobacter]MCE7506919.1 tRNA (adenosine(37)-N6)-threonylcarbamoyltransferase complex dimerization subunit type 1 TsaB [Polynucleobacter sp. IMCC30063]MCE7528699.1 tRNA (adenosine(37)-N6)-threonylcarbamoyltransferase complex dimerization subunit type 1 TsaB [Polynucleobacter sp. IMCC 29146]
MRILAIETSSAWCSVALALNQHTVLQRHEHLGAAASLHLLPWINTLLQEAELELVEIDAIAVDIGPGAFTGVRLGIACVQGLACGAHIPVISVMSLDSIAWQALQQMNLLSHNADQFLVILDARMHEVYWAKYILQDGCPVRLTAPQLALPSQIALEDIAWVVGSGVHLCSGAVQALAYKTEISAHALGVLGCARPQLTAGLQHDVRLLEPLYVRNKVAFTSAERARNALPAAAQ